MEALDLLEVFSALPHFHPGRIAPNKTFKQPLVYPNLASRRVAVKTTGQGQMLEWKYSIGFLLIRFAKF